MQAMMAFEPPSRTDVIYFHKYNRSNYMEVPNDGLSHVDGDSDHQGIPVIG